MLYYSNKRKGPLHGIKVCDLSRLIAGNMLSLQLADFGCDVIKIEDIKAGDPLRAWREKGVSGFWKVYSRNKRSMAINFRDKKAKSILLKMAETSDVFIESFRPGVMEEMGLSPSRLQRENAKLIIVRISGFGQTGPYNQKPGFGTLVEGMSGFASRNGFPDRPPLLPPIALADMVAGIQGAYATMVALREVELKSNKGQVIDLSLFEPLFSLLGPEALSFELTKQPKKRRGNQSNTSAPRDIYITKDNKYIALSASIQTMAEKVFKVIGKEEMINHDKFKSNENRVKNSAEVNSIVASWIKKYEQEEVLKIFERAGITAAPIYDISDIMVDPHIRDRETIIEIEDNDLGHAMHHNIFPKLSLTKGKFRRPAPNLGEHSNEILREAGFSKQQITRLCEQGVINKRI